MAKQSSKSPSNHTQTSKENSRLIMIDSIELQGFDEIKSIILNSENDWFVISNQSSRPTQEIQKYIKESNIQESAAFIFGRPKSQGGLVHEIFLGVKQEDFNGQFIALNKNCFQQILTQQFEPTTLFEWFYVAEKSCAKEYLLESSKSDKNKFTFVQLATNKFKTSSKFYFNLGSRNLQRISFLLVAIIALTTMMFSSKSAAISGDEFTQYEYSKLIANYYLEPIGLGIPIDTNDLKLQRMPTLTKAYKTYGHKLATIEDPDRLMHAYGSSFDTFTTVLSHWLGIQDVMSFRHLWNSIFGFLCALYTGLILRRLLKGNWYWAILGMVSVILLPRFFGEAMNNPKDIPFALGYIMSLYYAIKMFNNWPYFRWNTALGLLFGTALGISIRIGGLLSVAIFIMHGGLKYIQSIGLGNFLKFKWKHGGAAIFALLVLGLSSFVVGIFPWPYGWDDPINHPMKALKEFTNYSVSLRQLFDGKLYDSDMLPLSYLTKYLWITTPSIILIGLGLFVTFLLINRKQFTLELFLILFSAIFPIVYIYIQKSQVYGGIRQIMFTLPTFVILAIMGFYWLGAFLDKFKIPGKTISILILLAGFILPAKHIAQNHPLSYVYFNEIYGGTKEAYGKYEMDYYLASLKPSTEWFLENVARKHPEKTYEVLSYGMEHVKYYCRNDKNVHVGYSRFDDRSSKKWDYCIFYNAYFDQVRLNSGEFKPTGTVFQPMVDGVPVGIVIERPNSDDFEGIKAIESNNFDLGIAKLKHYLNGDPARSELYVYLSAAYASKNMLDSAIILSKKGRTYFPENSKLIFSMYDFYMKQQKYDDMIALMNEYIEYRPKDTDGFINKAQAELMKGKPTEAIATLQENIPLNPLDSRLYALGAEAYKMQQDVTNMNTYGQASNLNNPNAQTQQLAIEAIASIYYELTGEEFDLQKFLKQ